MSTRRRFTSQTQSRRISFFTQRYSNSPPHTDHHLSQDQLSNQRPSDPVTLSDIELTGNLIINNTESCEERKNSNTSIKTVQSTPKYTECMGADKPFANISNRRMMDNITRAVSSDFLARQFRT